MKEWGSRSLLHVLADLPPVEQEAGWGLATLRRREESFAPAGKGTTHDWFVVWLPTYGAVSIALYIYICVCVCVCVCVWSTVAITQLLFRKSFSELRITVLKMLIYILIPYI